MAEEFSAPNKKKSNSPNLGETLKSTCYQLYPSSFNLQQSVIMDEINSRFNSVGCVLSIPFFPISPFPSWKLAASSFSGAAQGGTLALIVYNHPSLQWNSPFAVALGG